jgi:hypothetical protein
VRAVPEITRSWQLVGIAGLRGMQRPKDLVDARAGQATLNVTWLTPSSQPTDRAKAAPFLFAITNPSSLRLAFPCRNPLVTARVFRPKRHREYIKAASAQPSACRAWAHQMHEPHVPLTMGNPHRCVEVWSRIKFRIGKAILGSVWPCGSACPANADIGAVIPRGRSASRRPQVP